MKESDPAEQIQALRAALAAERRKGAAFTELSHELRTLITGVLGLTGLLLDTDLTPEQRDYVKRVRGLSDALVGLVNNVLDFSRLETVSAPPDSHRAPRPIADPPPRPVEAPKTPPAVAADRPLVLLVEDNTVNQRVARLMLEKRGYHVEVACDGHEAVEATLRTDYAAVLMDCHMPRFDGYSATLEIRRRDAHKARVPIVAMTANAGPGARERCLGAGMDDYIAKPVSAESLDAVLRRWVRGAPAPMPAAPPRRPSTPTVDLGMLRKLRTSQSTGDPDIVVEVIALFLQDAPVRLAALREGVARGDLTGAARTAHTLKGSAGHLGAKTLSALCARFEEKVRTGAPFDVAFAVTAISDELDRVRLALASEPRSSRGGTPPPSDGAGPPSSEGGSPESGF